MVQLVARDDGGMNTPKQTERRFPPGSRVHTAGVARDSEDYDEGDVQMVDSRGLVVVMWDRAGSIIDEDPAELGLGSPASDEGGE